MIFVFVLILSVIVAWRIIVTLWRVHRMQNTHSPKTTDDHASLFANKENAPLRIDQKLNVESSAGRVRRADKTSAKVIANTKYANTRGGYMGQV